MEARAEAERLAPLYARICSVGSAVEDGWLLPGGLAELRRSVPDLDENRRRVLQYQLRYSLDSTACSPPPAATAELPEAVGALLPSPSGKHAARVLELRRKAKPRTCIELWEEGCLVCRTDCSAQHGRVLTSGTFGGFSWSPDEAQVVYVAEETVPEPAGFFSPAPAGGGGTDSRSLESGALPGSASWHREDWGEKLGGSDRLAIFVLNFAEGCVRKLPGVGEGITPGHPVFWHDRIVYTGWPTCPRRLGLLLCTQRPCALYAAALPDSSSSHEDPRSERSGVLRRVSFTEHSFKPNGRARVGSEGPPHACLTLGLQSARCARPSPNGERLAFLGSSKGFDTHGGCLELFVLDGPKATPRCIVEAVAVPEDSGFAGIYNYPTDPALPRDCWSGGSIYFNAPAGAEEAVWEVDVEGSAGAPTRVSLSKAATTHASGRVLAASDAAGLLLAWSDPCRPCQLLVRPPGADCEGDIVLPVLQPCAVVAGIPRGVDFVEGVKWTLQRVVPDDVGPPFDAILAEPIEVQRPGLIVLIHGGPHAVSTTWFSPAVVFLVRALDCAVLQVNYRGSAGFGQTTLESVAGNIGEQDVADCVAAARQALSSGKFDESRLAVVGGSHGGFLTAHLVGQYPDMFAAAAMRNPVINLTSMITATDIPDWVFVEGLGVGSYDFMLGSTRVDSEALATLLSASPLSHVGSVKTPTLVALGMKDRRVPPSQGMEFYHALKAKGVPTRLLSFPEDTHALDSPETDADHWVSVALWLKEHMPKPGASTTAAEKAMKESDDDGSESGSPVARTLSSKSMGV